MQETDLAAQVVAYLDNLGFDVYQEVRGPYASDGVADIVGVRGAAVCVVECKMTFGLDVIAQAERWWTADYRSVAIPVPTYRRKDSRARHLGLRLCEALGIGVIEVPESPSEFEEVRQIVAPRLNRRSPGRLHRKWNLDEAQKSFAAAGNADGKAWSPWRRTQAEVYRVVRERPGLTTREVVAAINHHYTKDSLAMGALIRWTNGGTYGKCLLPEVELRRDGRKFRWFMRATEPAKNGEVA